MAAVFELNKLFISLPICTTLFSNTLHQAKYLFHTKILSTKFDTKLALVLMVKEPSEASLHKLKGSLNYAERSEVQIFFKEQYIFIYNMSFRQFIFIHCITI